MTRTNLACTLVLSTLLAAPAVAQTVTVATGNGGTLEKSRACIRGNGVANCEVATTATTAGGETASKYRVRTTDGSGSTTTVSGFGPNGQYTSRTRNVTVSN